MNEGQDGQSETLPDSSDLSLAGSVGAKLNVVNASNITLATTFAQAADGEQVFLPLADWQLFGRPAYQNVDSGPVFEAIVPFDNIAYLLKDMSEEFYLAILNLETLVADSKTLSQVDVERIKNWLVEASKKTEMAASRIDQLGKKVNELTE